jgi:hypothetical protein
MELKDHKVWQIVRAKRNNGKNFLNKFSSGISQGESTNSSASRHETGEFYLNWKYI